MKINIFLKLVIILVARTITTNAQCSTNFTYIGTADTLIFTNLSTVANAHFYWNFGDGSGSNEFSPTHVFPDDGKYIVTLYGVDTLTNCVDVKESIIDVTKPDSLACNIFFTDTIIGTYPQTTNLSTNCSGFQLNCHVFGPAQNICDGFVIGNWGPSLFIHGMQATSNDSIYGYRIYNAYYKTLPYNYSSTTNYQNCSANFEYVIDYQTNYAVATFTAMNKNATNYTFYITGFGNPISQSGPSISYNYNYNNNKRVSPKIVYLVTTDTVNNCTDTVAHQILIKNPNYTFPINCAIDSPIQSQTAVMGANVQFYISASPNTNFQWQQDAGLGFTNLTNAGPYSGVLTNTLTISNVQAVMNNFQYRCIVYNGSGGCLNTSAPASLYVPLGIQDIELVKIELFPNPASSYINIDLPANINNATLTIYSLFGQQEFKTIASKQQTRIEIEDLPNGVYLVEVLSDHKVGRQMFIKHK